MKTEIRRKIERYQRRNGVSFSEAAAAISKRQRRPRVRREVRSEADINQELFEKMVRQRPDIYG